MNLMGAIKLMKWPCDLYIHHRERRIEMLLGSLIIKKIKKNRSLACTAPGYYLKEKSWKNQHNMLSQIFTEVTLYAV